jgi:hypothetical protein
MSARSISAIGAAVAVLAWSSLARAQTVVLQPGPSAPAPQTVAPAPVVATLQPAQPLPTTLAITAPQPPPSTPTMNEAPAHTTWRPDRTLLMSGLVLFGAPYIASVGIAVTSRRTADGNLAVPVIGPWLDLGGRRACQGPGCGTETGYEVLLAANGIMQTIGAFQIVGAFLFPDTTHEATTITTGRNTSLTIAPSRVGPGGYGLAAMGDF